MSGVLKQDAMAYMRRWSGDGQRRPGIRMWLRLLLLTPGFQLVLMIRLQHAVARVPLIGAGLRRIVWYWSTIYFACDIDPLASIGPGLYLPHPIGIVVGGGVRIGADVSILQNVTLGRQGNREVSEPIIGDGVGIGAGAAIFGKITIGAGARVGANSVVNIDIPPGAVAVGIPARIMEAKVKAGAPS